MKIINKSNFLNAYIRSSYSTLTCEQEKICSTCEEYVYDDTYFDETLATKFDLVCKNKYKKDLLGTILIIGLLFGSLSGGVIGDKFGRKKACFAAISLVVPVTIGAGHVQSYTGEVRTI